MKVIIVYEENHGYLCVAKNYKSTVKWLIDNHWIDDNTEVYTWSDVFSDYIYDKLINVLDEEWADSMVEKWDIEEFNDFWDDSFSMMETDLIEY